MVNFQKITDEIDERIANAWTNDMARATDWLTIKVSGHGSSNGATVSGLVAVDAPKILSEKNIIRALYHQPILNVTFAPPHVPHFEEKNIDKEEETLLAKATVSIETLFSHTVHLEFSKVDAILIPRMPHCMFNHLANDDIEYQTSSFTPVQVHVTRIHDFVANNIPKGHPLKSLENVKHGMAYMLESHYKKQIHLYTKFFSELRSAISGHRGALELQGVLPKVMS